MKKIILFSSLLISSPSFATDLHHYDQVKNAVSSGVPIHIVIDFEKCKSSNTVATQAAITGMYTPEAVLMVGDQLMTSFKHFTLSNPEFAGKAVYEYVKYTIASDDSVSLTSQVLDVANYRPLADKKTFNCKLDESARIYS